MSWAYKMLKWVVTRGPSGAAARVPPVVTPHECYCNKENHCNEFIEIDNNNSFAFNELGNYYSPRKCSLSSGPMKRSASTDCFCSREPIQSCTEAKRQSLASDRHYGTPLTSRSTPTERVRKLRTRRERNRTLGKRLPATSSLSPLRLESSSALHCSVEAELLQDILNENQTFNEREIKSPDEPRPIHSGRLYRQRVVRRKHSKAQPSRRVHSLQLNPNDSASIFDCFVFRELAEQMSA
ncbi:uncharacterized protein LOC129720246 [Wyeomyia smithii]|uniref:uncharacterized protein LOC129720246 n=1 Tax=Wyeomyia smithii TaxID=174621 RepID=UPI002467FD85|nr:uncharacterized protein LOC129720246 [Wyeomyia smithii]